MNQFKRRSVMYRLWILACAALLPALVTAQTGPAGPTAAPAPGDFEEIIVTGSRISREALESVSPVTVISGEQFRSSNAINVEEVLQLLPQVSGVITSEVNNGGDGTAQVALRALEPQRTLVLVNGRRMVPATNDGIVDINSIPAAMIERVEVVTGGASAIYGSDAIAGVINFILKDSFEGLEVNTIAGVSGEWDAQRYGINLTGGQNFDSDKGNVTFSLGYSKRQGVFQSQRDYTRVDRQGDGSSVGIAGRLDNQATNCFNYDVGLEDPCENGTSQAFNVDGSIRDFINELPENTADGSGDRYNFAPVNYLETPQDKWTITAVADYEINDHARPYIEGYFLSSSTETQLASVPLAFPSRALSLDNPLLSQGVLDLAATRQDPDAPLLFRRRMIETDPRQENFEFTTFQYVTGIDGDIADGWRYDTYYIYGQTKESDNLFNDISAERTDAALAGCPPGNLITGCQVVNFFGPGNITPSQADWLNLGLVADSFVFEQNVFNAAVTGDLVELPAGPLGVAFGYEWRKNSTEYEPGSPKFKDDLIGFNGQLPISGSFTVNEVFAEARAPLLKDAPFAERLDVEGAIRLANYSTVGSQTTWKLGGEWAPVSDVTFRTIYNQATRAPNVFELFQAGDSNAPTVDDPCATITADGVAQYDPSGDGLVPTAPPPEIAAICTLQGLPDNVAITQPNSQIDELQVGNQNLKEETAKTWSYGVVLQPRWVENFSVTIDYFDIKIDDYIDRVFGGTNGLVSACFASGITTQAEYDASPSCSLIERTASDELFTTLPLGNVSKLETSGVEAAANYSYDFGQIGMLTVNGILNYVSTWKLDGEEFAGESTFDHGTIPEISTNVLFRWDWQDLQVGLNWQHIDSVTDVGGSEEKVDAQDYFDLRTGYQVSEMLNVNLVIANLFNNEPPDVLNGYTNSNTDNTLYDGLGRYYTLSATLKF